ncbi:putative tyrosinase co-factor protein [Alloactinosynnema sp. L-07]|uniref:tyrosinase family oxidase copper chaperone n=1 Tax=Alloactinosynnema sp. L-07 TaxID=1653480 RepID=UPI00065F043E|nr:tyrosinase family oxidase copper chaperone [Alloactinosynnema sp. L-07]CRK59533.1 putative tyrosinase co-factor protein [Alloactinosynnema sp. L-07]
MNNGEMPGTSRRRFLTGAFATGALAVVGASGALIATSANSATATVIHEKFDEVYKGRRIAGTHASDKLTSTKYIDALTVDGDAVHVMRNGNGTLVTSVNHYEPFATLREAARAAVDTLGDARPLPVGHGHH